MASHLPAPVTEQVLRRIYNEYVEMPGLRLTQQQGRRLWGLDEQTCAQSLEYLVAAGFLVRIGLDTYARLTEGATSFPRPQMAKVEFPLSDDRRGRAQAS